MNDKTAASDNYDFSGSVAEHYDHYLGPLYFEPYAEEVAGRVKGMAINTALELAAGTGRVTNHLRKALTKNARLIASDLSADMLEVAKEKLKGENVEWRVIDATELPFDDNSIGLIVCCFGYMFVPEKMKAYSEALRVLKKGGMLLFTTWDRLSTLGTSNVFRTVAKKYLPDPPPAFFGLPYSMHDEAPIKDNLKKTGFSKVQIEKVEKTSYCESAKKATEGLTQGGVIYNEIMKTNPAWMDEIREQVEKQLTEKFGAAPMVAPMSALITQAWK